jgi:hypothetical protein
MKRRGNPAKFSLLCKSRREKFSRFIRYPEFYTEIPRIWSPKWWNVRENVDEKLKITLRLHPDAIPVVSTILIVSQSRLVSTSSRHLCGGIFYFYLTTLLM